jgi:Mg/Co/Ni transporter MgtE
MATPTARNSFFTRIRRHTAWRGFTAQITFQGQAEHLVDLDAIIVVDAEGHLVDDISLVELLLAEPDTPLADLIGPPWPVTVTTEADVREVADRLIDARRLSVVVLDEADRPLGRILADDVLDAVISGHRRWQFPRTR